MTSSIFSRRLVVAGAALGLSAALLTSAAHAAGDPLKIGVLLPLTGPSASFGTDYLQSISWAAEAINKEGGVEGRPLQVVPIDTRADPQAGIAAANRLADVDKAPAFLVSWSPVVRSTSQVANREKILQLSIGATSPEIAKLGKYTYTLYPLANVEAVVAANWQVKKLGKKRAAVVYGNTESGVDPARLYRDSFTGAGGSVVSFEAYDPKQADFTSMLLSVQAANPDIIWIQGDAADTPLIISQARQLGLTQTIATVQVANNPTMVQQLGAAADGLLVTSLAPGQDVNPNVKAFVEKWQSEKGRAPNGLPTNQYMHDAVYVLRDLFAYTLKKGREPTGENLQLAMDETGTFDTLPMLGNLKIISENGQHRVNKSLYILQVKDGKFLPFDVADPQ